jgi:hypothetical protein
MTEMSFRDDIEAAIGPLADVDRRLRTGASHAPYRARYSPAGHLLAGAGEPANTLRDCADEIGALIIKIEEATRSLFPGQAGGA